MTYARSITNQILPRFTEPRRFIQVLAGPRQVGKTTIARQIISELEIPCHYATADDPALKGRSWIEQQWNTARLLAGSGSALLVLDEAQKLTNWDEIVKRLWDEDSASGSQLHLLLLGSSPLQMQTGLTESLAGRFEVTRVTHWSFPEMREAFSYSLDDYIFYGGYPGSASIRGDLERWRSYIRNSLIETSISRDVLLVTKVEKPALLRRLFDLGCSYSSQELSYQKMMGQLQDAGNTTTLAHYLDLLGQVGLVAGIDKYAGEKVRQRASSPKLLVLNTSLITSGLDSGVQEVKHQADLWGRIVESAVGAHLLNRADKGNFSVHYWRDGKYEVDFVLKSNTGLIAIEVKSGRARNGLVGMDKFEQQFGRTKKLLVGASGVSLGDFLTMEPASLF